LIDCVTWHLTVYYTWGVICGGRWFSRCRQCGFVSDELNESSDRLQSENELSAQIFRSTKRRTHRTNTTTDSHQWAAHPYRHTQFHGTRTS